MIPKSFEDAYKQVKGLAERFGDNESAYLSPRYQEAEVRQDFLDKFFVALGWDVYHQEHPNPYEREVKIEKSVMVGDRGKRADYAFYTKPNFLQARFMAEAKKPARQLENPYDCFQAMRYGWNSNTPLAVLTDFEQFLVLDSRYKPSVEKAANGIIEKFHYTQFLDEESFRKIYYLFSREAVGGNSLEKFITGLKKAKTAKAARVAPAVQIQPVGDTFLNELDVHRGELAQGFKRKNPELGGDELTEITQRTLDRLVFIRFLEDKLVEPSEIIDRLGARSGSKWRDFVAEVPRLNSIYNGIIFKPHAILDAPDFQPDEKAFADTLAWLSHRNSAYDFNTIPIHILGSIYERFLGKTIAVTDKRARLEEKPEVRKAGGVYYTPEYIVRYIVENTIGKLLNPEALPLDVRKSSAFPESAPLDQRGYAAGERGGAAAGSLEQPDGEAELRRTSSGTAERKPSRKSPDEISKMRFADIACGSGSFLLGIFDYLIKYHVDWYSGGVRTGVSAFRRRDAIKAGLCRETSDGTLQLTLSHKRDILVNNIFGVDLDAQAVEVAQLSLYLKLLEEETTATAQQYLAGFREQLLPNLNNNIVHGNSLIDYDIMDAPLFAGPGVGSPHVSKGSTQSGDQRETPTHECAPDTLRKLNPMSFQSTFPEVFANGGFDAIVGNPPYVVIGRDLFDKSSIDYMLKYEVAEYKVDLFHLFIQRGIDLLRNKGELGFIVPNTWLTIKFTERLRRYILSQTSITEVVNFAHKVFADASVHTALIFCEKNKSAGHSVRVKNVTETDNAEAIRNSGFVLVEQDEWLGEAGAVFETRLEGPTKTLIKRLASSYPRLDEVARASLGCQAYNSSKHTKEQIGNRVFHSDTKLSDDYLPELAGRDVSRYSYARERGKWIKYGSWLHDYRTIDWLQGPRILIREISGSQPYSLQAAYLEETFCNYKTILNVNPSENTDFSMKYLVGILNSRLISFIYPFVSNKIVADTFPRLSVGDIKKLPVRTIDFNNPTEKAMHDRIVGLVERMIEAKKALSQARTDSDRTFYERLTQSLDNQIDELVYHLYDLSPEDRKIIEYD